MRVVIDHVSGTRRGQRQAFAAGARVRFGRHPECEVSFDPERDIDASSRHAELRTVDTGWVLVDLELERHLRGGRRITETPVARGAAISIDFGPGGPRVRLFVGDDAEIAALPPAPVEPALPRWVLPAAVGSIALVVLTLLLLRC